MLEPCDIHTATHAVVEDGGRAIRIIGKWGIDKDGHLAKPSQGGFGIRLDDGREVDMWHVKAYYREEDEPGPGWA